MFFLTCYSLYLGKYWDGEWFRATREHAKPYTPTKYNPSNTILVRAKL